MSKKPVMLPSQYATSSSHQSTQQQHHHQQGKYNTTSHKTVSLYTVKWAKHEKKYPKMAEIDRFDKRNKAFPISSPTPRF